MLDKKFEWNKVPAIGLIFWLTKLISTGQGESLSDWSSQLFGQQNQLLGATFTISWSVVLFAVFLTLQLRSEKYRPLYYWLSVALLAVFGTILADGLTGLFDLSHLFTTIIFALGMGSSFLIWKKIAGTVSIHKVQTLKAELSYWLTVMFSFAMGTALGDWFADSDQGYNHDAYGLGLGLFNTGILLGIILLVIISYRFFARPKENSFAEIVSFWLAYTLTRPVGASFADYFGYNWKNGFLGNKGMSLIWLISFILLLVTIIQRYREKEELLPTVKSSNS